MQNKGAIRFFTVVLALVSVYQLLFTVFTQKVERDARNLANGDVRVERSYLDSMKGEVVYNILFKKYTYQECKEREVNLGLDLKGGMNVILEIAVEDIIRSLAADQHAHHLRLDGDRPPPNRQLRLRPAHTATNGFANGR